MITRKIVYVVVLFLALFTADIFCIVYFNNKTEAYRDSLLVDWGTDKQAQVKLIYHYLTAPDAYHEHIKALTHEELSWYIENEIILKKVDGSLSNNLKWLFITLLIWLIIIFAVVFVVVIITN